MSTGTIGPSARPVPSMGCPTGERASAPRTWRLVRAGCGWACGVSAAAGAILAARHLIDWDGMAIDAERRAALAF
jgi:hypothetical protein